MRFLAFIPRSRPNCGNGQSVEAGPGRFVEEIASLSTTSKVSHSAVSSWGSEFPDFKARQSVA